MSFDSPRCAVWMVTYNHEKYIAEAIESVLKQETSFTYKLFIGDDCSSDSTTDICRIYSERYPDKIDLVVNEKNRGAHGNGVRTYHRCLQSGAEYLALCEGDDYWTDPHKLQKQIGFLESNRDYAICFHNSKIINDEEPEKISFSNLPDQPETSEFGDLAEKEFIYTATCLFRSEDLKKFPQKHYRYLNNYTLDLNNAQYGYIKYLDEVMSVYRKHRGGIWSMVAREKTLIEHLPVYKFYVRYFHKKYRKYFLKHLKDMSAELVSLKLANNDFSNFWRYYREYFIYNIQDRNERKHIASIFKKAVLAQTRQIFNDHR
ncbi:MAG TPA: glycosyltransferase [Puia sp.]|nr:glycosyltransferase [Puia sp.]